MAVYTIVVVLVTLTVPFLAGGAARRGGTLLLPRAAARRGVEDAAAAAVARSDAEAAKATAEQRPEQQQAQSADEQQQQHAAGATRSSAPPPGGSASKDAAHGPDCSRSGNEVGAAPAAAAARHDPAKQPEQLSLVLDDGTPTLPPPRAAGSGVFAPAALQLDRGCLQDVPEGDAPARARDQQRQQQPRHPPSVGAIGRVASMRSASFLRASAGLVGGLQRSFSRGSSGLGRSLSRSSTFVALTWAFPTGWQPQLGGGAAAAASTHDASPSGPRWWRQLRRGWAAFLAHPAVNLPLGASIAGIACAAVGPLRGLLVAEQAALHWLYLGLGWVGAAAAPLATLQIGAELMQAAPGGAPVKVPWRQQAAATAIAIGVKLVAVPLANVALLRRAGLAALVPPGDTVYQLLMLVEGAVPAAVTLLVTCSRVYPDIRPLARILWWQYVASLLTLPAFLVWFLWLLGV